MPSSEERAAETAARLSAAGLTPHVEELADHLSIEAGVPDSLPKESWRELLAALEAGDWFGFVDSSERGRAVWARFRRDEPATVDAVQRQEHQP